ncbi:MAG: IS4 family transposase [Candidatus Omnitrophota bacterium]
MKQINKNSATSTSKTFVGQPILSQIIDCIPKIIVKQAVDRGNADRYYKKIPTLVHLTGLLYGVFSHCDGLREICEGMLACEGKLNHLGLIKAPARSTFSDANNKRKWQVFEDIYMQLLKRFHGFLSDSRLKGLSIRNLKIIDSTTIRLFSDILQGVGRDTKDGSRKKGGIKVHTMMDAFSGVSDFVRMTAAKVHDKKFLRHLKLEPGSFIVFDKAYNFYRQFAKWSEEGICFFTRMKDNAVYEVMEILYDKTSGKNEKGVLKEEYVLLSYKDTRGEEQILPLRRITYKDDEGRIYHFITNNFQLSAKQVALIYKYRWQIELLFKQMKQNFPLRYFWGESENAIRIQIYCVLIAQLLMAVIKKKSLSKKSFSNIITVVRLHLMSYVNLFAFIKDTYRAWRNTHSPPVAPIGVQLELGW